MIRTKRELGRIAVEKGLTEKALKYP